MKEAKDSSPVDHTSIRLHYSSVSFPSPSKRQKIPPYTYLLLNEFSPPLVGLTIKTTRAHIL